MVNNTVTLRRKLGNRFIGELKRHFGTDQNVLGPVTFAFKAALSQPTSITSLSQFNPLSANDQKKRRSGSTGWTNREIESKMLDKKLIFATKDAESCDQWVSSLTFLVVCHNIQEQIQM